MSSPDSHEPLYRRTDDGLQPSPAAGGPWKVGFQHGGPPAALLARAVETLAAPDLIPTRLTVDLFRAVPMSEIRIGAEPARVGRRIAVFNARLLADDVVAAQASALFLLPTESEGAEMRAAPLDADSRIAIEPLFTPREGWPNGFANRVEARWVARECERPALWARMPMTLVEGEEPTPFQRLVALSDFANALAGRARSKHHEPGAGFINTDLSLHLLRAVRGEWIGLQLDSVAERDGLGLTEVTLYDESGAVGRCIAERLANRRG